KSFGQEIYDELKKAGVDVLYDDRDIRAGEKFADADLIGITVRLVVSPRSGDKIELKERKSGKIELLSLAEILQRLREIASSLRSSQ
ncbi:proline--tRNA ligase, partial [Patescibacteria group bacterium]|nr:proline--tRNA ligase [Patescibacteria group bacterium]